MADGLADRCRALIADLDIGDPAALRAVRPLTGGVASDIAVADFGDRQVCIKFALEKLKVAADWYAPVHRNEAEYDWLSFAASVVPESAPRLYGRSSAAHGFAMAYLAGDGDYVWKAALLDGRFSEGEAPAVAGALGRIAAASTAPGFDRGRFANRDDFHALRLEPYLLFTAGRHPALAGRLTGLAEALYAADIALVHGDVSPKNILFHNGHPVLLDAECATMGDPGFDVAFCLNHLVLKALHLPALRADLLAAVGVFWDAYHPHVVWEAPERLEARVTALLPALMLARVDGKSPVEYLAEIDRQRVRDLAIPLIAEPVPSLASFIRSIAHNLEV